MQQRAAERAEFIAGPDLAAGRIIHAPREPAKRRREGLRRLGAMVHSERAEEGRLGCGCAGEADPVDAAHGSPDAFVVAGGDLAARADAAAVRRAQAGGDDIEPRAVRAHAQHAAVMRPGGVPLVRAFERRVFAKVKVARGVRLQVGGELVVVRRAAHVVVEVLVVVRLAVAVQIVQPRDLVAPEDVYFLPHDLQPERLEESRGDAPPFEFRERVVHAADRPHIAAPCADSRTLSVCEEIKSRRAHPRFPRILVRQCERIHLVSCAGRTELSRSGDDLRIAEFSAAQALCNGWP